MRDALGLEDTDAHDVACTVCAGCELHAHESLVGAVMDAARRVEIARAVCEEVGQRCPEADAEEVAFEVNRLLTEEADRLCAGRGGGEKRATGASESETRLPRSLLSFKAAGRSSTQPVACAKCGRCFGRVEHWMRHVKEQHTKELLEVALECELAGEMEAGEARARAEHAEVHSREADARAARESAASAEHAAMRIREMDARVEEAGEQATTAAETTAHLIGLLAATLEALHAFQSKPAASGGCGANTAELEMQLKTLCAELKGEERVNTTLECRLLQQQQMTVSLLPHLKRSREQCPLAFAVQEAFELDVFDNPMGRAAKEFWENAVRRLRLEAEGKLLLGGQGTKLIGKNTQALWLYIYNNGSEPLYNMLAKLFAGPQRKLISQMHRDEFVAQGHPREFAARCAAFYRDVGYPPEEGVWIICWDPAKMQSRLQLDGRNNKFVGSVDFNSDLTFDSYQDWLDFRASAVEAGYIMPFVICPSDAALPSAVRVAAMIPTDLAYNADTLHGYLRAIAENLRAEGFVYIIVNGADNAAVHGTEMLRRALPEHYADEREAGGALGDEIASISTLRGFHEKGAACPTVQVLDPAHGAKNGR